MVAHQNEKETSNIARRRFLTAVSSAVGTIGVVAAAVPFVASMTPSERARAAGAPVEVDISKIEAGQMIRVEWRGKPVYIVSRTEQMLKALTENANILADPASNNTAQQPEYAKNDYRSLRPDLLVMVGICTHLGCAPVNNFQVGPESGLGEEWKGGFFCPCHGSKFDLSGRVFKNVPAGDNMVIPPYSYVSDTKILIGVNPEEGAA